MIKVVFFDQIENQNICKTHPQDKNITNFRVVKF